MAHSLISGRDSFSFFFMMLTCGFQSLTSAFSHSEFCLLKTTGNFHWCEMLCSVLSIILFAKIFDNPVHSITFCQLKSQDSFGG
jgi:hypothetical protein